MDIAHREDDLMHREIGQRIREARHARHMSLEELGGGELSRSFLSLVERGRSRISLRALGIVAKRLNLPMGYFIEGTGADDASSGASINAPAWLVQVRRPSPDRVTIELQLGAQDAVGRVGVRLPDGYLHVEVSEAESA